MRLPQKKKPGDPVLASDWNLLLDAVAARTPRSGAGLELVASSGGFAYSKPGQSIPANPGFPPFSVIGIEKSSASFLVTVKEGWVIERRPKAADTPAVKFQVPKIGGISMDTIPRPRLTMTIGQTAWCKVQTNASGEISSQPEIIAAAADQNGNHYHPEDPEGSGGAGNYFIKLFKLESDGGSPRVKVYQQSDIEHWAQLWRGINVGAGSRVFKRHDEAQNRYEFRTLKAAAPLSLVESSTEITVSFIGGANINWRVFQTTFSTDINGHLVASRGTIPEYTVYIRGGIVMGLVDPADNPPNLLTIDADRNSV
jgi:hypothetical protein